MQVEWAFLNSFLILLACLKLFNFKNYVEINKEEIALTKDNNTKHNENFHPHIAIGLKEETKAHKKIRNSNKNLRVVNATNNSNSKNKNKSKSKSKNKR